ncbi:MAG: hypothetical protein AB7S69_18400 [Salinivirgaceae bacterium]
MTNNSKLYIKDKVFMPNTASINIGSGCELIIDGGEIIGNDNLPWSGNLIVNGTLTFTNNSYNEWIRIGSGALSIGSSATINFGSVKALSFKGSSKSNPILVLSKQLTLPNQFTNVVLQTGKIVMNNSSAELYFNSGIGNVQVDKVWLTSSSGTRNNHQGMDIRCENFSVTQSTFEHGLYGLYISRVFNAALKPIVSCNFNNNYYGLHTNGGAYQISNCDFINNSNHSLAIYGIVGTTYVSDCYFSGATRGLYINSSGMGAIHVNGTVIENCNLGVYASNQAYLRFKCSSVVNMYSGIELYNNSTIHLASTGTIDAGGNAVSGNNFGIIGNGYPSYNTNNYFFLNNGYNDYSSNSSYALTGKFGAVLGGTCNSYNNKWRIDGGAPRNGIEYALQGTNGEPIFLYDPSPESYFSPCDVLKIAPGEELLKAVAIPDVDTELTRLVANAIALDDSVNLEKRKSSYRELANVLMRDYKHLSKTEAYSLHSGYQYMKQQLIEMNDIPDFDLYPFIHIMEKVQHKLGSDARAKKHSDVVFIVEYAQTLCMTGKFDQALTYLQSAFNGRNDEERITLEQAICRIEVFAKFNSDPDLQENMDSLLTRCEVCENSKKSVSLYGNQNQTNNLGNETLPLADEISISIVPHPVSGNSEIRVVCPVEADLFIHNSMGLLVSQQSLSTGYNSININQNSLKPGIYLVTLKVNAQLVQSVKILVLD